jgi:Protein of unknown function (DUF3617)
MRSSLLIFGSFSLLLTTSLNLQAESVKINMKPGLWENTFSLAGDSGKKMEAMYSDQMKQAMAQMKEQFAKMPPEQRKQMEAMMAQTGMKVEGDAMTFKNGQVQVSEGKSTVKSCITQAQIDRGEMPDPDDNCKATLTQTSKNTIKSKMVCEGENSSVGESDITFHSPQHYTGSGKMTQTINGKPQMIETSMEGKWLSADCGDVLPEE